MSLLISLVNFLLFTVTFADNDERWTIEKANKWYEQQGWLVGGNYVPSNAINQLEMWQEDTFDAKRIDTEFGWAKDIGINTI